MNTIQRSRSDWAFQEIPARATVLVDPGELGAFEQVVAELRVKHEGRQLDDPVLLSDVEIAARALSHRLLTRLVEFRTIGSPDGTLLVRGLPVDDPLPPTPANGRSHPSWALLARSTLTQLAVMSVLGEVIAYADEEDGWLVQDVCPVAGAEQRQENTGSTLLELHTEDGFHPFKPEMIGLACLRGDHELTAWTVTASIRSVLADLPESVLECLRRPVFRIRFSTSFVGDGPSRYSDVLPVLSGPLEDPDLCVDFHAMEAVQEDGTRAMAVLREAMTRALVGTVLRPGDLLVVDNRVAVHGRTGFVPRYDGTDRWLRRCFVVSDLRPSRGLRPKSSRVCEPVS